MKLFPWADYNRKKAAFKMHVGLGLDHVGLIPAVVTVTSGKASEMKQARQWQFTKGSGRVFDKGYNSYAWHNSLSDQVIIWVTRIRGNALYRVIERRLVAHDSPVTSDQVIEYTGKKAREDGSPHIHRIGFRDPDTGKHYVFITNQFKWSAQTITDIYQQRWQFVLFFKWIKQNLKIKVFLGIGQNAVMTQVLVALCLYLLLAYLKFQSKISKSLQQILKLLQLNLFIRRPLLEYLKPV